MKKYLFYLFLIIFALIPRLVGFNKTPIFPDEITWMVCAKESFLAVRTFNLKHINEYFQSDSVWWNEKDNTQAISLPLVAMTGPLIAYLGKGQSILSRNLLPDYVVARLPLVFVNSVFIIIVYLLAERMVGKKIAIFASLLYALDPVSVAYSRLILSDSLLIIFTALGLYSFFYIKNEKLSILLSSVSLAFGFLSKPNGILIVVAWATFLILSKDKRVIFVKMVKTLVLALIMIEVVWPAAWYHPFTAIFEYLYRQTSLVDSGMLIYFMGKVTDNPPFYYYLYQTLVRLPSYITIGLFFYFILIVRMFLRTKNKRRIFNEYKYEWSMLVFFLAFLAVITIPTKKSGIRYALPLWPLLYIASSWAIVQFFKLVNLKKTFIVVVLLTVFSLAFYNFFVFYPHYDYYYSELAGGPKKVQNHVLVGLCYGAQESVEYIKRCFPQISTFAYIGCSKTTVPYYYSGVVTSNWKNDEIVVVEESYRILGDQTEEVKHFNSVVPEKVIDRNGAVLTRLYLNDQNVKSSCDKTSI